MTGGVSTVAGGTNPHPDVEARSIFREYFDEDPFEDRYTIDSNRAVDVVIPVMHTNELWARNLHSIYRNIPVKRLLLGDGGCVDRTIDIAREYPRVEVHDHRHFVSLGYSIRKLIEAVETEWFVYLHSDVYLPPRWFDAMSVHQGKFDWYECRQHLTILIDYPQDADAFGLRAYSGSQMGRTSSMKSVVGKIDDDYLYRFEDVVIEHLARSEGLRYGFVDETFHFHQHMLKRSKFPRKVNVSFTVEESAEEKARSCVMQARAIIKYLPPARNWLSALRANVDQMMQLNICSWEEFETWVSTQNPAWLPLLQDVKLTFRRLAPPPPPVLDAAPDTPKALTEELANASAAKSDLTATDRDNLLKYHAGWVRYLSEVLRTRLTEDWYTFRNLLSHSKSCIFYRFWPQIMTVRRLLSYLRAKGKPTAPGE